MREAHDGAWQVPEAEDSDPVSDVRRLKRVIQQSLQYELANAILGGEFADASTIRVEAQHGEFAFQALCGARVSVSLGSLLAGLGQQWP